MMTGSPGVPCRTAARPGAKVPAEEPPVCGSFVIDAETEAATRHGTADGQRPSAPRKIAAPEPLLGMATERDRKVAALDRVLRRQETDSPSPPPDERETEDRFKDAAIDPGLDTKMACVMVETR